MARVKYGSIITEIRGKLGGHTLQKTGQSLSIRTTPKVAYSRSQSSMFTRNQFSSLASLWRTMSESFKATFTTYAPTYPTFNTYGESIVLTGYQLFMYLNRPLVMAGYDPVTECTSYVAPPSYSIAGWTIYPAGSESIFEIDGSVVEPYTCLIYMSRPYVPPRNITTPHTVYVGELTSSDVSSVDLWNNIVALFPNDLIVGRNYYGEAWMINKNTGCSIRIGLDLFIIE